MVGCPAGMVAMDTFEAEGMNWTACEDVRRPDGAIALIPKTGGESGAMWFEKTYEPYSPKPDSSYYLGLGKQTVLDAKWDMLTDRLLHGCKQKASTSTECEVSWKKQMFQPRCRGSFTLRGSRTVRKPVCRCSRFLPQSRR